MAQDYNYEEKDLKLISDANIFNYCSSDIHLNEIYVGSIVKPNRWDKILEIIGKEGIGDAESPEILDNEEEIDIIKKKVKYSNIYPKDFVTQEKWIESQRSKYPNEVLAFTIRKNIFNLIGHAKTESKLLEIIKKLIKKDKVSKEEVIYFDN